MTELRNFRRVVRCHRSGCPIGEVRVRRADLVDALGLAELTHDARARVTVRRGLGLDLLVDTVIHEWAHLLAWRRHGTEVEEHGSEWGLAHAECYRAFWAEWHRRGYDLDAARG